MGTELTTGYYVGTGTSTNGYGNYVYYPPMEVKTTGWEDRNQRISDFLTGALMKDEGKLDSNAINEALKEIVNKLRKEGEMAFGLCEGGTKCHLCGASMVLREQAAETEYRNDGTIRFDTITNKVTYKCDTTVEKTTAQTFKKNKDTEPVISTKTYVGSGCIEVKGS